MLFDINGTFERKFECLFNLFSISLSRDGEEGIGFNDLWKDPTALKVNLPRDCLMVRPEEYNTQSLMDLYRKHRQYYILEKGGHKTEFAKSISSRV